MFKKQKQLESKNKELFLENQSLKKEIDELKSKSILDLTREALKIVPIISGFNENDVKYQSTGYQKTLGELDANQTLKDEIERIINEQVIFIATQSTHRDSDMIARGRIDGLAELLRRIESARDFIAYKRGEDKGEAEEV